MEHTPAQWMAGREGASVYFIGSRLPEAKT
jgi:hypothetical protein